MDCIRAREDFLVEVATRVVVAAGLTVDSLLDWNRAEVHRP